MHQQEIAKILISMEAFVKEYCSGNITHDGLFLCCLKAGLAKNYELNRVIFDSTDQRIAFALTSSLRGLCEDIIGLRYVSSLPSADRDKGIDLLLHESTYELIEKQQAFFKSFHPAQMILGKDDAWLPVEDLKKQRAYFEERYQWPKQGKKGRKGLPSVHEMAGRELLFLYDYLYAATSSIVHFTPRNLLRIGWGDVKAQQFEFSTTNFAKYDEAFNQFYGLYLFITFCTMFCSMLGCRGLFQTPVDNLIEMLVAETHWPELVTFEEMNMGAPKKLWHIFAFPVQGGQVAGDEAIPKIWTWA